MYIKPRFFSTSMLTLLCSKYKQQIIILHQKISPWSLFCNGYMHSQIDINTHFYIGFMQTLKN